MKPVVAVALLAGSLAAVAALGRRELGSTARRTHAPSVASGPRPLAAPCPPDTLPDEGVCIPVKAPSEPRPAAPLERIPRRPDRPADYLGYALPVASRAAAGVAEAAATPGADGGAPLSGLALRVAPGTQVSALELEGQTGPALVVYAGPLVGATLATLHEVRNHERTRRYLVLVGNLASAPSLAPRASLAAGAPVGVSTETPLHLDVRLVRPTTDVWALPPESLADVAFSIPEDPRNVLARAP